MKRTGVGASNLSVTEVLATFSGSNLLAHIGMKILQNGGMGLDGGTND